MASLLLGLSCTVHLPYFEQAQASYTFMALYRFGLRSGPKVSID